MGASDERMEVCPMESNIGSTSPEVPKTMMSRLPALRRSEREHKPVDRLNL